MENDVPAGEKIISPTAILVFFILFFQIISIQPAMANNPPGPQQFSVVILIIPIMFILTLIGCPPSLRKEIKGHRAINLIIIVFLILFAATHEGASAIVILIFAAFAFIRAFKMIKWGIKAKSAAGEKLPGLKDVKPLKMFISGSSLILITIFLVNTAFIFFNDRSYYVSRSTERNLQDFVTFQLAYARLAKLKTGYSYFYHNSLTDKETEKNTVNRYYERSLNDFAKYPFVDIKYGKNDTNFTIHLLPVKKYSFPYNYFISLPSYYADQSGNIRKILVHNYIECPDDAPIVMKIEENEIIEMQDKIKEEYFK